MFCNNKISESIVIPGRFSLRKTGLLISFFVVVLTLFTSQASSKNRAVLNYNLKYGFIKGGEATMIITDTLFNGKKAIYYRLDGRTTGVTDRLFRVHNIYESIVDAQTFLPLKAVRNAREGNWTYYNEVFFFHQNDSIFSEKSGGIEVPRHLTDILSVFFYFVHQDYITKTPKGQYVELPVINGHDISTIKIKHDGIQSINTDLGKVSSYILLPEVDKGKVLKSSDGLLFYITEKDKVPVLFDLDLRLGSLRAVLTSYHRNGKAITVF
jgi:hypothetical protein